jgi:hypothetical protein
MHIDPVGQLWAAGGIPLCTRGDARVTITSIAPVVVRGQIRLSRIAVRRVHWPSRLAPGSRESPVRATAIGTYPGVPPGSRAPAGFVVPSPSPCAWTDNDPVYETVVVAARTGPHGGYVKDLRVRYDAGSARGEYIIRFTYAFCGPLRGPGLCGPQPFKP